MIFQFSYFMPIVVFVLMFATLFGFRWLALKYGLVDVPDARKIHKTAIPVVGGLVLFLMAVFIVLMTKNISSFIFYLVMASGFVVLVGLLDDLFQLSALWRFVVQIFASLLVIYYTNVQLNSFGYLLSSGWELKLGLLSIPVTVFGVVGVINALNMADGIDGLAAMTFVSPVVALAYLSGFNSMSVWSMLFILSVLVFVFFNKSIKYKIFLGDSGSLLLGFILAWLLVYFSQGATAVVLPVTALYLVALPLYDTIFVMLKRMLSGHSPFQPDKTHLHHLFLSFGLSQTKTLFAIMAVQLFFIGLGLLFMSLGIAEHLQFYCFVLISVVYYLSMKRMWNYQHKEKNKNYV